MISHKYKSLLSALLVGEALSLHAATPDSLASMPKADPLYFQFYGGINKSANENLPWTEFTQYPWSGGVFVGLGKELSPLWGWRAAFRFNHNKSRNVQTCESPDTWGWNNIGLFADLTFDITDAVFPGPLRRVEDYRKWNVKAFAGVGGAWTFGFDDVPLSYTYPYNRGSQLVPGFRAGVTATYQVAEKWRVGVELSQNMYGDKFNGVKANAPLDGRTNLKIGVTYLLAKTPKKPRDPIIYDTRLRKAPELPFVIPDSEKVKIRKIEGRAFLDFPVNETVIYSNYRRNPQELKRIKATVDSALFDETIQVQRILLHGYASPESPYSNNTRLSIGRAESLRDYLLSHYNALSPSVFTLETTPEDWDNLRDFIEKGNSRRVKGDIWYESMNILETPEMPDFVLKYRDDLLRVIDLEMDKDEKEDLLKQVGGGKPYNWLHQYVYPGLRHTDYLIEYIVRQYPVKDGRRLIYTHPEALSLNEIYQVANSYEEGSDEWLDALLIAAKQYPDNQTANLNAACACIRIRVPRLTDAKAYIAKAGDTEEAQYVRLIISAMDGSIKWKEVNGKIVEDTGVQNQPTRR